MTAEDFGVHVRLRYTLAWDAYAIASDHLLTVCAIQMSPLWGYAGVVSTALVASISVVYLRRLVSSLRLVIDEHGVEAVEIGRHSIGVRPSKYVSALVVWF